MDWSNQVAIVTGGASGIGQATVQEFAQSGVRVAIFDVQAERSQQVRDSLVANGGIVDTYTVDVANDEAVQGRSQHRCRALGPRRFSGQQRLQLHLQRAGCDRCRLGTLPGNQRARLRQHGSGVLPVHARQAGQRHRQSGKHFGAHRAA